MSESQRKVLVSEATGAQLRHFAETHLGMKFQSNMLETTMRAKVAEAWTESEIPVEEEAEPSITQTGTPPAPPAAVEAEAAAKKREGKVKILIHANEDESEIPVFLSVNGVGLLVTRGVESWVPERYLEVLQNATQLKYDPAPGGGLKPPREVPSYPYSVLDREAA